MVYNLKEKTKLGRKIITKIFKGNPYREMAHVREVLYAQDVENDRLKYELDLLKSQILADHEISYQRIYTQEDDEKAHYFLNNSRQINSQIQEILER